MKNVLVPVQLDAGQEARFQAGCEVVLALRGHLNCLGVRSGPSSEADFFFARAPTGLLEDSFRIEGQNWAKLEADLNAKSVSHSWIDAAGPIAASILKHASLNDLVIVGSNGRDGADAPGDVASQIIRGVGRPVLAVPHLPRHLDVRADVLVAWDGSSGSDAALRGAIPLLRLARKVHILSVGETGDENEAVAYCELQGVRAVAKSIQARDDVSYALIDYAEIHQAAYVVMGGYGHSPIQERLFGGVTHEMLNYAPMPLFIAV